jgi:hypothetical protein
MKTLKLKEKYKGLRVTRSNITIGKITFDANSVKEEHYQNYYDLGFTELFEVIEVCDNCKNCTNGECICNKEEKPKRKRKTPVRRKKKTDNNDTTEE